MNPRDLDHFSEVGPLAPNNAVRDGDLQRVWHHQRLLTIDQRPSRLAQQDHEGHVHTAREFKAERAQPVTE